MQSDLFVASIKSSLAALHAAHKACSVNLEIVKAPIKQRALHATQAYARGELKLVPTTFSIALKKTGEQAPDKAIALPSTIAFPAQAEQNYTVYLMPKITLPSDKASTSGHIAKSVVSACVAPFWFARSSGVASECNAKLCPTNVNITISCDGVEKHAEVSIPILVSNKAINAGDEIVYYKQQTSAASAAPKAKRAKRG